MKMNRELAQEIVDISDRWCLIQTDLYPNRPPQEEYIFFGIDKEIVLAVRKDKQLGNLAKSINNGRVSLTGKNFAFRDVSTCKIVGWDEETIPEHVKKTPIYDCKE